MTFYFYIELLKFFFGYLLLNKTLILCTLVLTNNGNKCKKEGGVTYKNVKESLFSPSITW